jgi:hypothetical protein
LKNGLVLNKLTPPPPRHTHTHPHTHNKGSVPKWCPQLGNDVQWCCHHLVADPWRKEQPRAGSLIRILPRGLPRRATVCLPLPPTATANRNCRHTTTCQCLHRCAHNHWIRSPSCQLCVPQLVRPSSPSHLHVPSHQLVPRICWQLF